MTVESRLPSLPNFQAFLEGARPLSDDAGTVQEDCQRPCRMDAPSIVKSTDRYNTPALPRSAQTSITRSLLEDKPACKSSSFKESEIIAVRQRNPGQWPGCSHVLIPSEGQAEHKALSHKNWSSSDSKALRAKPSVRCALLRRATFKTDNSDMDQVVQHKVKEDKVAHKRAEQKRRNENSSSITALKLYLPSNFLDGCQPRNQKPGYTKNGTLKAVLSFLEHQATIIEEQKRLIEAQAATIAALNERVAALMLQDEKIGTWNV